MSSPYRAPTIALAEISMISTMACSGQASAAQCLNQALRKRGIIAETWPMPAYAWGTLCRSFTPAQPNKSAASVLHYRSAIDTTVLV